MRREPGAAAWIEQVVLHSLDPEVSAAFVAATMPTVAPHVRFEPTAEGPGSSGEQQSDRLDPFWKLSVFTDDVDRLRAAIVDAGRSVSAPVQFGDIGYLCHLTEPGGNEIELLQRTFEPPRAARPLAHDDRLGLITLRVADLDAALRFFTAGLGMRTLATMTVDDGRPDPFGLHFLGLTDDEPPDADPGAVANREWLYQRGYAMVELQHHRPPGPAIDPDVGTGRSGLARIVIGCDDVEPVRQGLSSLGFEPRRSASGHVVVHSPDGHRIDLVEAS